MKILFVCSKNSGKIVPFILEQADCLVQNGCKIDFYTVTRKGFLGYLSCRRGLLQKISDFQPDIIHAHYGLSGLLANLQRCVPVVTTYHGRDINKPKVLWFSKWTICLSRFNIFVSQKNIDIAKPKKNFALIPCGINFDVFKPLNKVECRRKMGFSEDEKLVLFSSNFDNQVKNPQLAKETMKLLPGVKLLELKGYTREQVCLLMNAVDAVLMTSHSEGSPQFIKEAMACNCPVASVDVGDVREVTAGVEGCFICDYSAEEIAGKLQKIFKRNKRTDGNGKVYNFDNRIIIEKILNIYKAIL